MKRGRMVVAETLVEKESQTRAAMAAVATGVVRVEAAAMEAAAETVREMAAVAVAVAVVEVVERVGRDSREAMAVEAMAVDLEVAATGQVVAEVVT